MAQKERVEFRASSAFVDRLEELATQLGTSRADVIRTAIDTLEMVAREDREGRGIVFVAKNNPSIDTASHDPGMHPPGPVVSVDQSAYPNPITDVVISDYAPQQKFSVEMPPSAQI